MNAHFHDVWHFAICSVHANTQTGNTVTSPIFATSQPISGLVNLPVIHSYFHTKLDFMKKSKTVHQFAKFCYALILRHKVLLTLEELLTGSNFKINFY